jgi:Photosynthetic reaction centre cytochrome C subunit
MLAVVAFVGAASVEAQTPRADGHGRAALDEYNRALGVECSHCHVPDQWQDESKAPKATARKMSEMVTLLNGKLLRGIGEVSCWTCHGGQVQPARLPADAMNAQLARWPAAIADAAEAVKLRMAVYSSSTGLRCTECHTADNWKRFETDKMRLVPRMAALFPRMEPFMPPTAQTQCYMCHKGENKPKKTP